MNIAHFSDLHVLAPGPIPAGRLANKRLTGWLNLRLKRGAIHRPSYTRAIARRIAETGADHVVVTGDFTNLSLESEFELARDVLEEDLGLDPSRVTVVPGNHDVYTRGALASRRFENYFDKWLTSDLPELVADDPGSRFPVVKLRGPVAIVALCSAVPQPPMVAAGLLGRPQLDALQRILAHPEVSRRVVVVALHHPVVQPTWSRTKRYIEGLRDAPELLETLRGVPRGLLLHGHLHRRVQRDVATGAGRLQQVGATSASLQHEAPDRMAGFNLYEIDEAGVHRVRACVYSPETDTFHPESVPKHV